MEEEKVSSEETEGAVQESAVSTEESKKTIKKRPTLAEQDQAIANFIVDSKRKILLIKEVPEILVLMIARGYNLTKLAEGETLQQALEDTYTARQNKLGQEKAAQNALDKALIEARDEQNDFRQTVRAFFKTKADQEAIGIWGILPKDIDKLILVARTSYTNATKEPFKSVLAQYGYDDAGVVVAQATVTALENARIARDSASTLAIAATATRNDAYSALVSWMQAFDRIAGVALRKHPALLARL